MAFLMMGLPPSPSSSSISASPAHQHQTLLCIHLLQHKSFGSSRNPGLILHSQLGVSDRRDLKLSLADFRTEQHQSRSRGGQQLLLPNLVDKVFGPTIFQASKLHVMFLGIEADKHPEILPRIYTLTHCDITAVLTLTISQSINKAQLQGWYQRLQRDDVIAIWRKCQGTMSLQVHCHISGSHWWLETFAGLRYCIFKKELPLVLEAFRHGDEALLKQHPELDKAPVWVYFHSNLEEFNKVEYWGPLESGGQETIEEPLEKMLKKPSQCTVPCRCCFPT